MKLQEYYNLLQPENSEKLLFAGESSILMAAYFAGAAEKKTKEINCYALVPRKSEKTFDIKSLEALKVENPGEATEIQSGATRVSYEKADFSECDFKDPFARCAVETERLEMEDLMKLLKTTQRRVLLILPVYYYRLFEYEMKSFMIKEKRKVSFKKILETFGFKVTDYVLDEKRLVICANVVKANDKMMKLNDVSLEDFGKYIVNEIGEFIFYADKGTQFAIESDNKEYLYYVRVDAANSAPLNYSFVFLDGKSTVKSDKSYEHSKSYDIIVTPNNELFRKDLESKNVLIIGRTKVFDLFGDKSNHYKY